MKEKTKGFLLGLLSSFVILSMTITGFASFYQSSGNNSQSQGSVFKQLQYKNIKITLDGKTLNPTDANGNSVEPFIIDGTTYLPVRAIAGALDLNVEWDSYTSTVKLSTEQVVPKIYSKKELSNYLNSEKLKDNFTVKFEYLGNDSFGAGELARMINCCYLSYSYTGNVYTVTMQEYPGDKVVDAYFSGDTSKLNADEVKLLSVAKSLVNEAKRNTTTDYELEMYLHQKILEAVTYNNPGTDIPDPTNVPHHLTAIGALLDGYANCQGYTDAFYTLASIAGFDVSRLSVVQSNGEKHMLNTIELGGKWYLVDATHNDGIDNSAGSEPNFFLFNAGKDMCPHLSWVAENEYFPIVSSSDANMIYYADLTYAFDGARYNYTRCFSDLDSMAKEIVGRWSANGQTEFNMMLAGNVFTWSDLSQAMKIYADRTNKRYSYTIWCNNNGRDTFYYIIFN